MGLGAWVTQENVHVNINDRLYGGKKPYKAQYAFSLYEYMATLSALD